MAASIVFLARESSSPSSARKLCLITQRDALEETDEFTIPDSGVVVKLREHTNYASNGPVYLLVHLANDIVPVTVADMTERSKIPAVLRSNYKTVFLCARLTNHTLAYADSCRRLSFWLTVDCPWRKEFTWLLISRITSSFVWRGRTSGQRKRFWQPNQTSSLT